MNPVLKLVVTFLLLGSSPAYAQSVAEPENKPFHITSRGSAFGVQGEFEGTYQVLESSIEVYVSKATIYVSEHCPYQGRRRINYFTFGLRNQETSTWKLENRAQSLYLDEIMSPREEHLVSDLHFSLPIESTLDLTKRWLVVEIQEDVLDAPSEGKGYAFVHSCTTIVDRERSAATDQKTPCKK